MFRRRARGTQAPSWYPRLAWPAPGSYLEDHIDRIEHAGVLEAAARLRLGAVQPPKVWMFVEGWDPPLVATVSSRPYRPGADAAAAIGALGVLPAALAATHLLVMWDEAELSLAQSEDQAVPPDGVVAVQATLEGHSVHWYPYRLEHHNADRGEPTASAAWGTPSAHEGTRLPGAIATLLAQWRAWTVGNAPDPAVVIPQLKAEGFVLG